MKNKVNFFILLYNSSKEISLFTDFKKVLTIESSLLIIESYSKNFQNPFEKSFFLNNSINFCVYTDHKKILRYFSFTQEKAPVPRKGRI